MPYFRNQYGHDVAEVCSCNSADCSLEDVMLAVNGDADALGKLSTERLQNALDCLDGCRHGECPEHGNERWARRLLDSLIDKRLADESEMNGCDRCRASTGCAVCLGVQGGM